MQTSDLVRMANQITDYFAPYPKAEALDGIAKHIHLFWDPRMRNALKKYIDQGGEDLQPLFLEAAAEYFKGPKTPPSKAAAQEKKPVKAAEASTKRT
jgi:formate dehydrogenase subunit delta